MLSVRVICFRRFEGLVVDADRPNAWPPGPKLSCYRQISTLQYKFRLVPTGCCKLLQPRAHRQATFSCANPGVQRDSEGAKARREGHHVHVQQVLPDEGDPDLEPDERHGAHLHRG